MPLASAEPASQAAYLDLERLSEAPLCGEPFDHVVVPGFLRAAVREAVGAGFPKLAGGGSFPAAALGPGPAFARLLDELQGPAVARAFAEKFGIDLAGRPATVTLRGRSRLKDGRIHADSASKLITVLIYLNRGWTAETGRLRLLRGPGDIEDFAVEVPPEDGMLVAFRCRENAWHGYKPFVGPRRSIQLNWVTDAAVARREVGRHGLSAFLKSLGRRGRRT